MTARAKHGRPLVIELNIMIGNSVLKYVFRAGGESIREYLDQKIGQTAA